MNSALLFLTLPKKSMISENAKGSLETSINNRVATVTFSHPSSNSFPRELLNRLTAEFSTLDQNPNVSVIVIQSSGTGAFCAGASFDELLAVQDEVAGTHFFSGFANLINAMRNCSKLIIGRVHGKAVGGGVGIASACDYVMATQHAAIKLSELAIGIGPFVIEPAVTRKIGKTAMSEMTLAAQEWKSAEWAKSKGLYAVVCDSIEELDLAVSNFSNTLSSYNPEALLEMKKVLWEGTQNWDTLLLDRAAISGKLVLSEFTKNALAQFKK